MPLKFFPYRRDPRTGEACFSDENTSLARVLFPDRSATHHNLSTGEHHGTNEGSTTTTTPTTTPTTGGGHSSYPTGLYLRHRSFTASLYALVPLEPAWVEAVANDMGRRATEEVCRLRATDDGGGGGGALEKGAPMALTLEQTEPSRDDGDGGSEAGESSAPDHDDDDDDEAVDVCSVAVDLRPTLTFMPFAFPPELTARRRNDNSSGSRAPAEVIAEADAAVTAAVEGDSTVAAPSFLQLADSPGFLPHTPSSSLSLMDLRLSLLLRGGAALAAPTQVRLRVPVQRTSTQENEEDEDEDEDEDCGDTHPSITATPPPGPPCYAHLRRHCPPLMPGAGEFIAAVLSRLRSTLDDFSEGRAAVAAAAADVERGRVQELLAAEEDAGWAAALLLPQCPVGGAAALITRTSRVESAGLFSFLSVATARALLEEEQSHLCASLLLCSVVAPSFDSDDGDQDEEEEDEDGQCVLSGAAIALLLGRGFSSSPSLWRLYWWRRWHRLASRLPEGSAVALGPAFAAARAVLAWVVPPPRRLVAATVLPSSLAALKSHQPEACLIPPPPPTLATDAMKISETLIPASECHSDGVALEVYHRVQAEVTTTAAAEADAGSRNRQEGPSLPLHSSSSLTDTTPSATSAQPARYVDSDGSELRAPSVAAPRENLLGVDSPPQQEQQQQRSATATATTTHSRGKHHRPSSPSCEPVRKRHRGAVGTVHGSRVCSPSPSPSSSLMPLPYPLKSARRRLLLSEWERRAAAVTAAAAATTVLAGEDPMPLWDDSEPTGCTPMEDLSGHHEKLLMFVLPCVAAPSALLLLRPPLPHRRGGGGGGARRTTAPACLEVSPPSTAATAAGAAAGPAISTYLVPRADVPCRRFETLATESRHTTDCSGNSHSHSCDDGVPFAPLFPLSSYSCYGIHVPNDNSDAGADSVVLQFPPVGNDSVVFVTLANFAGMRLARTREHRRWRLWLSLAKKVGYPATAHHRHHHHHQQRAQLSHETCGGSATHELCTVISDGSTGSSNNGGSELSISEPNEEDDDAEDDSETAKRHDAQRAWRALRRHALTARITRGTTGSRQQQRRRLCDLLLSHDAPPVGNDGNTPLAPPSLPCPSRELYRAEILSDRLAPKLAAVAQRIIAEAIYSTLQGSDGGGTEEEEDREGPEAPMRAASTASDALPLPPPLPPPLSSAQQPLRFVAASAWLEGRWNAHLARISAAAAVAWEKEAEECHHRSSSSSCCSPGEECAAVLDDLVAAGAQREGLLVFNTWYYDLLDANAETAAARLGGDCDGLVGDSADGSSATALTGCSGSFDCSESGDGGGRLGRGKPGDEYPWFMDGPFPTATTAAVAGAICASASRMLRSRHADRSTVAAHTHSKSSSNSSGGEGSVCDGLRTLAREVLEALLLPLPSQDGINTTTTTTTTHGIISSRGSPAQVLCRRRYCRDVFPICVRYGDQQRRLVARTEAAAAGAAIAALLGCRADCRHRNGNSSVSGRRWRRSRSTGRGASPSHKRQRQRTGQNDVDSDGDGDGAATPTPPPSPPPPPALDATSAKARQRGQPVPLSSPGRHISSGHHNPAPDPASWPGEVCRLMTSFIASDCPQHSAAAAREDAATHASFLLASLRYERNLSQRL